MILIYIFYLIKEWFLLIIFQSINILLTPFRFKIPNYSFNVLVNCIESSKQLFSSIYLSFFKFPSFWIFYFWETTGYSSTIKFNGFIIVLSHIFMFILFWYYFLSDFNSRWNSSTLKVFRNLFWSYLSHLMEPSALLKTLKVISNPNLWASSFASPIFIKYW